MAKNGGKKIEEPNDFPQCVSIWKKKLGNMGKNIENSKMLYSNHFCSLIFITALLSALKRQLFKTAVFVHKSRWKCFLATLIRQYKIYLFFFVWFTSLTHISLLVQGSVLQKNKTTMTLTLVNFLWFADIQKHSVFLLVKGLCFVFGCFVCKSDLRQIMVQTTQFKMNCIRMFRHFKLIHGLRTGFIFKNFSWEGKKGRA